MANEEQFECLEEGTENIFSVPTKKEVRIVDKDRNKKVKVFSYRIKFIDNARFMAVSLSNLVDNLSEEIHKVKC